MSYACVFHPNLVVGSMVREYNVSITRAQLVFYEVLGSWFVVVLTQPKLIIMLVAVYCGSFCQFLREVCCTMY